MSEPSSLTGMDVETGVTNTGAASNTFFVKPTAPSRAEETNNSTGVSANNTRRSSQRHNQQQQQPNLTKTKQAPQQKNSNSNANSLTQAPSAARSSSLNRPNGNKRRINEVATSPSHANQTQSDLNQQLMNLVEGLEARVRFLESKLTMLEASSQSKLSEMSRQLVTLTDKITALEAQNTVVQNGAMSGNSWGTVASLAPRSSVQNVVRPSEQQREIANSVLAEQQDRERRKRNVLIFGLQA